MTTGGSADRRGSADAAGMGLVEDDTTGETGDATIGRDRETAVPAAAATAAAAAGSERNSA